MSLKPHCRSLATRAPVARRAQQRLHELAAAFTTAPHGLALLGLDARYIAVNPRFASMHGLEVESLLGRSIYEMRVQYGSQLISHLKETLAANASLEREITIGGRSCGGELVYLYTWNPVHDAEGEIVALSLGLVDITERKRVEAALGESKEHYRFAMELSPHIPWTASPDGARIEVSSRWTTLTQLPAGTFGLAEWAQAVYPADLNRASMAWSDAIRTGQPYDAEYRVLCGDKRLCWVRARASARRDARGTILGWYGILENIDATKQIEVELREKTRWLELSAEQLAVRVSKDHLTGLANRRHFDDMLHREVTIATQWQLPLSLVMIDVDHFKSYNDNFGHLAGDQCLRSVATVLASVLRRPTDLVARYGGEEFAFILPNTSLEGARKIASDAVAAVRALALDHSCAPDQQVVTISAGVAALGAGRHAVHTSAAPHLIQSADAALYAAKNSGRDQVVVHESAAGWAALQAWSAVSGD